MKDLSRCKEADTMVGGGELAGPLGAVRDDAWAAARLAGRRGQ